MSAALRSDFVFALCQVGAERALKAELARTPPELRPSYQRPGVVTFRGKGFAPDVRLQTPLARAWGLSFGMHADVEPLVQTLSALPLPDPVCLHVCEREQFRERAPSELAAGERAARVEAQLRAALGSRLRDGTTALPGELVLDVIVGDPGEPMLLGAHLHTSDAERSPHPGGGYVYDLPADAPSRAYRKLEEALRAFQLPVQAGDVALELGAAPGGAAYALLRRGVHVIGVDPGEMDPRVSAFCGPGDARLTHVQLPMAAVDLGQLPERIDWLLLDVHLAPQVALRQVSRFASHYRSTLLGAVLTLKLNDWAFLEALPRFLDEARALGLAAPRARQLPAHRKELAIAGLTRHGLRRST